MIQSLKITNELMNLQEIGWDGFFSSQFARYEKEDLIPARIFSEQKKSYVLFSENGELKASARGILWHQKESKHPTPVVGDWVAAQLLPGKLSASIKAILPRKSSFSRISSGGRKKRSGGDINEQIIAANVDIALIIAGLDREFNLRRIERYMALVQKSGMIPIIILNKADLCKQKSAIQKDVQNIFPDVSVLTMVALKGKQVFKLNQYIKKGQTAALLGSSGVGKSTIINQLLGYDRQKVSDISTSAGKGQHTTSRREIIILPSGGLIMDNPGMREIQLWAGEDDLYHTFTDIETIAHNCRFRDCRHEQEPGCAVKEALHEGILDEGRLKNYIKIKSELTELAKRQKLSGK
jgi:ribosome biogenesis GTPase